MLCPARRYADPGLANGPNCEDLQYRFRSIFPVPIRLVLNSSVYVGCSYERNSGRIERLHIEVPMSEATNTEIVKKGYEHFSSGDVPGLLNLFTDDIDWSTPHVENAPFTGNRLGLEEVGEFFKLLTESEDISYFEPTEFIAQGDRVVVLGRSKATVKSTGRSYETDWVHLFTIHDGKITNFHEFFDSAAATRAFQKTAAA